MDSMLTQSLLKSLKPFIRKIKTDLWFLLSRKGLISKCLRSFSGHISWLGVHTWCGCSQNMVISLDTRSTSMKKRYFCLILHSYIKHSKDTFRFLGNGFYVKQIVESLAVSGSARASYASDELSCGGCDGGGGGVRPRAGRSASRRLTWRPLGCLRVAALCVTLKLS